MRLLWLLAPIGICLASCLIPYWYVRSLYKDPHAFMARIPDDSRLVDLDPYIDEPSGWTSVREWTLDPRPGSTEQPVKFPHGTFYVRDVGSYQNWSATLNERENFSGEIIFSLGSPINLDDFAPMFTVSLFYVDGVLVEKNLGRLAG